MTNFKTCTCSEMPIKCPACCLATFRITPPPEREHKPSAEVEALRGEVAVAEVTG